MHLSMCLMVRLWYHTSMGPNKPKYGHIFKRLVGLGSWLSLFVALKIAAKCIFTLSYYTHAFLEHTDSFREFHYHLRFI